MLLIIQGQLIHIDLAAKGHPNSPELSHGVDANPVGKPAPNLGVSPGMLMPAKQSGLI